jgi:membrane protease YdiL (CAAX protease family)
VSLARTSARWARPTAGAPISATAIAVGGVLLLMARTSLLGLPAAPRAVATSMLFLGIGAAALVVPVPEGRRRLPAVLVLAAGVAGVVLAAVLTGEAAGLPLGTWTIPLALLAAVTEELLFRRLAYGALAQRSETLAVLVTGTAFALVHLPLYGVSALPVDLGAGLLLSWQRWASGSWTVPAATHVAANLSAVMR